MQLSAVLVAILVNVVSARPQGLDFGGAIPVQAAPSQSRPLVPTTPKPQVPIIRHINRVNNDGSYTFGYESGDGSFRVETKGLDGVIKGKYGYIDENGQRKEVDYLAGSDVGYEPSGQGITVPPRPPPRPPGQQFLDYDDGSGTTTSRPRHRQQSRPVQHFAQEPQPRPRPRPQPQPQQVFQPQPQFVAPPPPASTQVTFQAIPFPSQAVARQAQPVASFSAPSRAQPQHGPSPIEAFLRAQLQEGRQQVF